MANFPNAELVAIYWLKGVDGLNPDLINTTVPANNSSFAASGFVQVQALLPSAPNPYTNLQVSTVQVDLWGYNANSNKLPWGKTFNLAMLIKEATEDANDPSRLVSTPAAFDNAYVNSVIVTSDPRRVLSDAAFARYTMELDLRWVRKTS